MWVAEIGLVVVVCCNCGFWIAYLGFEISNFMYCVLGLGLLRVRRSEERRVGKEC